MTVEVLSALFRRLFLEMLVAAHHAGRLQFFGDHARLADKAAFRAYLKPLRKIDWVVYAKEPFAGPRQVLRYLSRYTHRIAISNRRLCRADENGVAFKYKDYRIEGPARYKTMTLATDEFIRRFLIHVLPKGFHRIRHYGLLASATAPKTLRTRPRAARRAASRKAIRDTQSSDRPAARAAAAMPVLRRPHDRHRDLRARLRAQAPAFAAARKNQDRHLMMPSPAIHHRSNIRHSCWLPAGSAQARIGASDSPPLRATNPLALPRRSLVQTNACDHRFAASRSRQPLQSSLSKPEPAAKSP